MKKCAALAIGGTFATGLAAAASAQTPLWPVTEEGQACSIAQSFTHPEFGATRLEISYDAARHEVRIASTNAVDQPLRTSGDMDWIVVFLDNDGEKFDDQWGQRAFHYTRDGNAYRFETAFSGDKNVRQIFADLGNSRAMGFMDKRELVVGYDLDGARSAITRLNGCAQRVVASN